MDGDYINFCRFSFNFGKPVSTIIDFKKHSKMNGITFWLAAVEWVFR